MKHNVYYEKKSAHVYFVYSDNNKKGKAAPLQTWSGPEGSRKLKFPDFMTTAQDCGKAHSDNVR